MKLLLISNSYAHQCGYLDHCASALQAHFENINEVLFIPYATRKWDDYAGIVSDRFQHLGIECQSIHTKRNAARAVLEAEAIFVGGGNTFLLLDTLYKTGIVETIRNRVLEGTPYAGSSAGSNLAGVTISTTNDMPIIWPPTLRALGVVPYNINPHYYDVGPESKHMGESRETRIREFQEHHRIPVLGLREGAWIQADSSGSRLGGVSGARLFRPDGSSANLESDTEIGSAIHTAE